MCSPRLLNLVVEQEFLFPPGFGGTFMGISNNSFFKARNLSKGGKFLPRKLCVGNNPLGEGFAKASGRNDVVPNLMCFIYNDLRTWGASLPHQAFQTLQSTPLFLSLTYSQSDRRHLDAEICGSPLLETGGRQASLDGNWPLCTPQKAGSR